MTSIWDALWQTWPVRMAQSAFDAAKLPGDVYTGNAPMLSPGLRREDFTDMPGTAQPNDATIGRAADLASLIMSGTFGIPSGTATLGSGPMVPSHQIEKLRSALNRSGIDDVVIERSRASKSTYLEARIPDWKKQGIGPHVYDDYVPIKVRASDHDLPDQYRILNGKADYQIGNFQEATDDSWVEVAKKIIPRAGLKPDPVTKSQITKMDNKAAADLAAKEAMVKKYKEAMGKEYYDLMAERAAGADDAWLRMLKDRGLSETIARPDGVINEPFLERLLSDENLENFLNNALTISGERFRPLK